MRTRCQFAKWCALNVLCIVLSVVALETGVRLTHAERDLFWEADPLLGWRLIPGQSGWWVKGHEYRTRINISAQGYRDVPHAVQKPRGVFRVLVLGDSNAEAMQVPLEKSFPRLLEKELNRRQAVRVEVINTGVSNYSTASQLLLLRRDGVRYQPDLVLLTFVPGNNVLVNSPELEKTLIPVYGADGGIERVRPPFGKTGYLARSKAYLYLRRLLLVQHPQLAGQLVRFGMLKAGGTAQSERNNIPTHYYVYHSPPDATWQKAWAHTERLLDDLRKETRRIGAGFMVAILSSREEVYPEWWEEELQTYPNMRQLHWDLDAPWRRIASFCEAKGIPCLALTPIERAARNGKPLHYHYDGHLTPAGNQLVARALAEYIFTHGLLQSPASEVATDSRMTSSAHD
jgi:lysophospholipase L1-like esterase